MDRRILLILAYAVSGILGLGCDGPSTIHLEGQTMGTTYSVVYQPIEEPLPHLQAALDAELKITADADVHVAERLKAIGSKKKKKEKKMMTNEENGKDNGRDLRSEECENSMRRRLEQSKVNQRKTG